MSDLKCIVGEPVYFTPDDSPIDKSFILNSLTYEPRCKLVVENIEKPFKSPCYMEEADGREYWSWRWFQDTDIEILKMLQDYDAQFKGFSDSDLRAYIFHTRFEGVRRVWAAFGQPGGGWEFTAVGTLGGRITYENLSPTGLLKEEFNRMVSPILYGILPVIRKTIIDFIRDDLYKYDEKNIKLKDIDLLCWAMYFPIGNREYTISLALKDGGKGIKIWGVWWDDTKKEHSRCLSECISEEYNEPIQKYMARKTILSFAGNEELAPNEWLLSRLRTIKNALINLNDFNSKGELIPKNHRFIEKIKELGAQPIDP